MDARNFWADMRTLSCLPACLPAAAALPLLSLLGSQLLLVVGHGVATSAARWSFSRTWSGGGLVPL